MLNLTLTLRGSLCSFLALLLSMGPIPRTDGRHDRLGGSLGRPVEPDLKMAVSREPGTPKNLF